MVKASAGLTAINWWISSPVKPAASRAGRNSVNSFQLPLDSVAVGEGGLVAIEVLGLMGHSGSWRETTRVSATSGRTYVEWAL
jgi:hypothetical protein